jgi:hypothetical protein
MSICLVIPTMKRNHTGFEYISKTLDGNSKMFKDGVL